MGEPGATLARRSRLLTVTLFTNARPEMMLSDLPRAAASANSRPIASAGEFKKALGHKFLVRPDTL